MRRLPGHADSGVRHAGTALLTALVVLTVLTLLGTFGMQQARLEQRMAGHARFRAEAFAGAEYVLAAAEADLDALQDDPFSPDRPGDHYYPRDVQDFDPATPGVQGPADRTWRFGSARLSLPDIDGDGSDSDGDGVADDGTGRYVIQEAGRELALPGQLPPPGTATTLHGTALQAFLVTARSRTPGGVQRTLQGVYVRPPLTNAAAGMTAHGQPAAGAPAPHLHTGRRGWIDLPE